MSSFYKPTSQGICALIYCCICWIIATPLLLFYLYEYYKLYKYGNMGVRKKHFVHVIIMEAGIISLVAIVRPIVVLMEFNKWHNNVSERISRGFFVLSFYAIMTSLVWRIWILYYDTKLNQWQENHSWKRVINAKTNQQDWYRKNRIKFGSSIRIGIYLSIISLINCIIHYSLYSFINNAEPYFQIAVGAIYALSILIIYVKLPKKRDIFQLNYELKISLYIGSFAVVAFLINVFVIRDKQWGYNFFEEVVYLLCCTGIGLMSTAYALFVVRYKTQNLGKHGGKTIKIGRELSRNRTISKTKKSLGNVMNVHSLSTTTTTKDGKKKGSLDVEDVNTPETSEKSLENRSDVMLKLQNNANGDEQVNNQSFVAEKFNYVLSSEQEFELFMIHIKKEFSMENMLGLIEFCQYEDIIIEQMDQLSISSLRKQSAIVLWILLHFLRQLCCTQFVNNQYTD